MFTDRERNEAKKIRIIQGYLNQSPIDIDGLKQCSVSEFGFVNAALRRRIWPLLLNIDTKNLIQHRQKIIDHPETDQVLKDVERSMWRFTKGKSQLRNRKKPELMNIVNAILSIHKELHYFQGYHEIGSVLLLVTDESLAFAMLERLSLYHFRDCMYPTFASVLNILHLLFPLIQQINTQLYNFIIQSQVQPLFAISWVLTWFSHNLEELEYASRVYDFFLSSHPLASLYFSAVVIDYLKDGLLDLECSYDTVHAYFTHLPENLPLDHLIKQTNDLLLKIPPNKLQSKSKIHLGEESPMNRYPYDWMKKQIINSKLTTSKKYQSEQYRNNADKKRSYSTANQIYKYTFFVVFGSISLLSVFVYLSIRSPSTTAHLQFLINQYLPNNIISNFIQQYSSNSSSSSSQSIANVIVNQTTSLINSNSTN
ncbi:RabGAP/TBC domain-containing protein [Tieghemostelium lacteum]|uniref:RabGAP/TBC domain-containing protein n=1 Tax=Tieghemostelium lacteum TaxID=361077 RepID=A0A151Z8D0_TIELA|nr:RabGAP/TBC domain-containing protein [Tieghemostelium lacteum]|eukprot:KYQ90188.1 RabGAP/TBC domain-containing protein [Tieghemostelium lacteum]